MKGQLRSSIPITVLHIVADASAAHGAGIEIYPKNRAYWPYDGKPVHVSKMLRDFPTPRDKSLSGTQRMAGGKFASLFDYPEIYSFFELSETSTRFSDYGELWPNIEAIRRYTAKSARPMTNIKVSGGGDNSTFRKRRATIHRFCELACAGRSAVRFHRPVQGGEDAACQRQCPHQDTGAGKRVRLACGSGKKMTIDSDLTATTKLERPTLS